MLVVQALIGLLSEKGFMHKAEILRRIAKLKQETSNSKSQYEMPEQIAGPRLMIASVDDLIDSNMMAFDVLLALLVEKAFLTEQEMEDLVADFRKKAGVRMRRH